MGHCHEQRIEGAGLTKALCVDDERLAEFAQEVANLKARRSALEQEVANSTQAINVMLANLERRGFTRGVLEGKLAELNKDICESSEAGIRSDEAQRWVTECEAAFLNANTQVESITAQRKEAEAQARDMEIQHQSAESRCVELERRENELMEICNNAPVQLQRIKASLEECGRRRAELAELGQQLATDTEQGERWTAALRSRSAEAEVALRSVKEVRGQLEGFQQSLNSELVLTDAEVDRLRDFDLRLHPHRPSRLREPSIDTPNSDSRIGDESGAPLWDSIESSEQEYRGQMHFRSFSKLCAEREQLWSAELKWVKESLALAEPSVRKLVQQRAEHDQQERQASEEEARLQGEEDTVGDFEGHAARLAEARDAAAEAHEAVKSVMADVAEAKGTLDMAILSLEQARRECAEADDALTNAHEAARIEAAKVLQARDKLQACTSDIEGKTRDYLQEWRKVELEEHRLALLQSRVSERLQKEADGRASLRAEAHRLIEELHDLDRQLDVGNDILDGTQDN
jgi:chromosome segregation ATPase